MLTKFVDSISPNVSPLQGNTIEDDERVSFGIVSSTQIGNQIDAIDWSDSINTAMPIRPNHYHQLQF